jgi:hypothetical protein
MHLVSRFEANLLTIARAITGQVGLDEALHLLRHELLRPKCLSRTTIKLLKDSLTKGVVQRFATLGWQETRHLQAGQVVRGRIWQRTPLAARQLHFSPASVELLLWLTASHAGKQESVLTTPLDAYTLGDRLLVVLTAIALERTELLGGLLHQHVAREEPLLELLSPAAFDALPTSGSPNFDPWLSPERVWVLEALQSVLANWWADQEQAKRQQKDRNTLIQHGQRQQRILAAYLDALEAAGRYDLARFLLVAGGKLLLRPHVRDQWFANLDLYGLRLADRQQAYEWGLGVMSEFGRLARWRQEAGLVAYYDEGYAASQLFKADWDALRGDEVCAAAADLVRHFTSLQRWEAAL